MALKIITGPTVEPVSLQQAKLHLRVIGDPSDVSANPEDTYISALIVAARQRAEHLTGRALMPQTLELALDSFSRVIRLPRPPLASVSSVKYLDVAGNLQTLDPSAYIVDDHSEPACLLASDAWPVTKAASNAVLVRYVAGYATAQAVPDTIKSWMLLCIGMLYANRESVVPGVSVAALPGVDRLLDGDRFWSL